MASNDADDKDAVADDNDDGGEKFRVTTGMLGGVCELTGDGLN